ncbi:MOSC domain-containing protein [bacterium]|nr:MOSC domain-containing protein [bacterium]
MAIKSDSADVEAGLVSAQYPGKKMSVVSVNISTDKGTTKRPLPEVHIDEKGIKEDAHAGVWHRQLSLLSMESVERFSAQVSHEFLPGDFAENITTRGIDLSSVAILDRIAVGEAELEVTQIGKACHPDGCGVFKQVGKCVMPKEGIFCRVLSGGRIAPGDEIILSPRPLLFSVITLSDRASRGEYKDRSGPRIRAMLEEFFVSTRWRLEIRSVVIADEPVRLRQEVESAVQGGASVIITTGGTGVGSRDITPDVIAGLCDKTIPGIMEFIRVKCGETKPNALLSRSVAGTIGKSQIYALPGSVRAVEEYMSEILKTMEHLILTLHDIDPHQEQP